MIPLQLINYGVLNPGLILVDHINLCHVSCWDRFKHQSPRWGWFVDFQHPWATRPETRGLQRLGGLFILHEAQLLGICFKFIPSYFLYFLYDLPDLPHVFFAIPGISWVHWHSLTIPVSIGCHASTLCSTCRMRWDLCPQPGVVWSLQGWTNRNYAELKGVNKCE